MREAGTHMIGDTALQGGYDKERHTCMEACLAVLFQRSDVPKLQRRWWRAQINNWALREYGLSAEDVDAPHGLCIAIGPSPRGYLNEDGTKGTHAVLFDAEEGIVWDPHESDEGLRAVHHYIAFKSPTTPG